MNKPTRRPFELFSWAMWDHIRRHADSLDSERWTREIQTRMIAEVEFVSEPLRAEVKRLRAELEKAKTKIADLRAERKAARAEVRLLDRKARHGCFDALCAECDGEGR